jgi:hypothetical protein
MISVLILCFYYVAEKIFIWLPVRPLVFKKSLIYHIAMKRVVWLEICVTLQGIEKRYRNKGKK